MALPPSWKGEIESAVEETEKADRSEREAQTGNAAAQVAAAIHALKGAQDAQTSREDCNQKISTALNVVIIVIASVAAFFAGASWWVFSGQLNEMQAEQRPWVYAANIEPAGRIVFVEGQYAVPLKFTIKNTGHLPAFFVAPKTSATVLKIGMSTKRVQNEICDEYRKTPVANGGDTVFAGQVITHGGFTSDDYPTVLKKAWDLIGSDRMIVMYGCIDYQFADQPWHHQSRFSYAVGQRKDQGILERIGSLPDDPTTVDFRLLAVTIDDGVPAD